MRVPNYQTRVCFPKPIFLELIPPGSTANTQELGDHSPPFEERQRLLREYLKMGFGERAIVVLKGRHPMYYTSPYNWGIITVASAAREVGQPWKPFLVKWVNNSMPTRYDPDELVLIHDSLDEKDVTLKYNYGEYD